MGNLCSAGDECGRYRRLGTLLSGLFVRAFTYRVWVRSQLQQFLKPPELPVRRMLLNTYVEPAYTVVRDDRQPVTVPPEERTYLWPDDHMPALPSGFFNDIPSSASPLAPDTPLPVEVMGLPRPGEWVLVRSPQGTLGPTGRAKHCYSSEINQAIRCHRPLPKSPRGRNRRQ